MQALGVWGSGSGVWCFGFAAQGLWGYRVLGVEVRRPPLKSTVLSLEKPFFVILVVKK